MAEVNSATFTVTALAAGDDAYPVQLTMSYTNTNTRTGKDTAISVGTAAFEDVIGTITGTTGAYLIKNTDSDNFITLRIYKSGADSVFYKVPPLSFYIHNGTQIQVDASEGAFSAFVDITAIEVKADTGPCLVNIFKIQTA
jgi:hypothetical protein